ncbi:hypothetical protein BU23DRAFT_581971 [Bimuria novae-zelandiae CBS 107.79]|uniref:Uncharacterized protein n=1 Tax=Bimuria novae-zelandiae CBS 107.79 TaxID=1447943 RepID=A0A6A5V0V9_9PLEO|nr:hypothetical protein BU23DRAFT_581971 [Bimuria novae-zelandiae CBS 107.79]
MRLLNASTITLESFYNEATTPRYAILSHTWGDEEVSFQDLNSCAWPPSSKGFYKIRQCCELVLAHGIKYAWVDTCCIDTTSSSELSEGINSLFKWYLKADVCYAYLEDLGKVRLFKRGWTLQELIAPNEVIFFAQCALERITGIDDFILTSSNQDFYLKRVSVARRMSWAATRETTRPEDITYCLLGIFDVNVLLLYGEGEKAFVRLQEEIMKNSDNQSLFLWVSDSVETPGKLDMRTDS